MQVSNFQLNLQIVFLSVFFNISVMMSTEFVQAFPIDAANVVKPRHYAYDKPMFLILPQELTISPCTNCQIQSYITAHNMHYRNGEHDEFPDWMGISGSDSSARFNIHLYLDHMWHLNLGFSK